MCLRSTSHNAVRGSYEKEFNYQNQNNGPQDRTHAVNGNCPTKECFGHPGWNTPSFPSLSRTRVEKLQDPDATNGAIWLGNMCLEAAKRLHTLERQREIKGKDRTNTKLCKGAEIIYSYIPVTPCMSREKLTPEPVPSYR
ncbi:hypothetical protein CLAIMM_05219 [Cladophialophora immunda]|nr:hypothetical protein CLAIMM_05219 [Cladophialophora immunda]